jgi:hypothetical protein
MRFGTSDVRNLCRAGLLKRAACELAKYNLDLVAVQEVRWDKYDNWRTIIHFCMEIRMLIIT